MRHKVKQLHFVGIGGAGMSGIAEVLVNLGYKVTGSDAHENAATQRLRGLGVQVFLTHEADHIAHADAVVISTAIASDNPEVVAARAAGIPVVARALMLAELMRLKKGIAIAGTHGKTTTTSLVASILAEGGFDPTFVIGGRLLSADANARLGTGEFIVAEADESDASFLHLMPVLSVVTNIDADHMDTYAHDFSRVKKVFIDFLQRLPFYGAVIACMDDANVREILPQVGRSVIGYGFAEDADLRAIHLQHLSGMMRFTACQRGFQDLEVTLSLPGEHSVKNALAAIAVGREIGVADRAIQTALMKFKGVDRRFQHYGKVALKEGGHYSIIDDYGHHPTEIAATMAALKGAYPNQRLVLAFQPHRYTRTRDLFEDFVTVLSEADVLVLTDVYPAGEQPIVAADGRALARAIRVAGMTEPIFVERVEDMKAALDNILRDGDILLTMGAGNIGALPAKLIEDRRV
ncbi:MAG: UDP-N-acetylmuramate--L-alanine ligase [Burkholderiales bacterium]|jgi:UDP-N-acetylmuramate--alanine ligase|nr:UDP-N-acetylmuramate--L-alanine ligase [Burkholderiales bacterium]